MRASYAGALALALVLAACAGRDKDEGEQPAELTEIEQTVRITRLWSTKLGGDAENLRLGLAPASDGPNIYAASHDGHVLALDAATGNPRWRTELELPLSAGPGLGENLVVVGSTDGALAALSADDGAVRWQRNLNAEILARPLIAGARVFVRTVDGNVRALDSGSGNDLWNVQREMPRLSLRGNSTPVIAGNRLIVAFDDGKVAALDLQTGDQQWESVVTPQRGRTEIERLADIDADVRLVGNELYVVGYQSRAVRLVADTGQEQWSVDLSSYEAPGVDWVHVYITDEKGEVVALDRASGAAVWRQSALRMRSVTGPTPYGQAVVVGDYEGFLHWLSVEDGRIIGRARADGGAVGNPPLVVADTLYVQTDGGILSAWSVVQPEK
jgi:outer membrane protein assembly factor BamB